MPGLFGDAPGPISGLGGLLQGLAEAASPAREQMGFQQRLLNAQLQSLMQMPEFQGPGGAARALATIQNPKLQEHEFVTLPQQEQLRKSLTGPYGAQAADIFSQRPGAFDELLKPQKLEPGGSLVSPLGIPGAGGNPLAGVGGGVTSPLGAPGGGANVIANNTNGMMPPEAIEDMVSRRLVGDTSVEKNFGGMGPLGKLNQAAYQKRLSEVMKERGITPQDLVASTAKFPAYEGQLKRLATIEANMGTARMEFEPIWNAFKQAMAQVNGQFPTWNALKQFLLKHAGDPRVAPLAQYTQALENVYGRAISTNPQGPTVHDKTRSEQSLNTYWNAGSLNALENALRTEMDAAKGSIPKMRNKADVEQGLGKIAPPDILAQARDALKRGAPKDRIIDRLAEQGLKADGL